MLDLYLYRSHHLLDEKAKQRSARAVLWRLIHLYRLLDALKLEVLEAHTNLMASVGPPLLTCKEAHKRLWENRFDKPPDRFSAYSPLWHNAPPLGLARYNPELAASLRPVFAASDDWAARWGLTPVDEGINRVCLQDVIIMACYCWREEPETPLSEHIPWLTLEGGRLAAFFTWPYLKDARQRHPRPPEYREGLTEAQYLKKARAYYDRAAAAGISHWEPLEPAGEPDHYRWAVHYLCKPDLTLEQRARDFEDRGFPVKHTDLLSLRKAAVRTIVKCGLMPRRR